VVGARHTTVRFIESDLSQPSSEGVGGTRLILLNLGKEARQHTAGSLRNQFVRLEIQQSPTSRDRYGRLLAYVFCQGENLLISNEIIRQGYGYAYMKYPFYPTRMKEFQAAEREARENQRGLWGVVKGPHANEVN
jgi:endonuclease YncB( thermonuclease family)